MKVIVPIIGLLAGTTLLGCNPSENKVQNSETAISQQKPTGNQLRTDTIPEHQAEIKTVNLVKHTLSEMFKDDLSKNLIDKESKKFKLFEYDINQDSKKEIFVGLMGPYFCGSGGCTLLVLDPEGKLINKFTVTDYPISIADSNTKGWNDLILTSNGKDHLIKFNGKTYPANPSLQPVYSTTAGKTLAKGLDSSAQVYLW